jgi:hypothetical protein
MSPMGSLTVMLHNSAVLTYGCLGVDAVCDPLQIHIPNDLLSNAVQQRTAVPTHLLPRSAQQQLQLAVLWSIKG